MVARQKCIAFLDFSQKKYPIITFGDVILFQNHRATTGRPYDINGTINSYLSGFQLILQLPFRTLRVEL